MKLCKWHWARLKKDLRVDDKCLLYFNKAEPFTIPEGTLVWAHAYVTTYGDGIRITVSDKYLEKYGAAYQSVYSVHYSDLLEPLE